MSKNKISKKKKRNLKIKSRRADQSGAIKGTQEPGKTVPKQKFPRSRLLEHPKMHEDVREQVEKMFRETAIYLNEPLEGPAELGYLFHCNKMLNVFGMVQIEFGDFPSLERCFEELFDLFISTAGFEDERFVENWVLADFPLDPSGVTCLDLFEAFVADYKDSALLRPFIDNLRASRLGVYQVVMTGKRTIRVRELVTGKVHQVENFVVGLEAGHIMVARLLSHQGKIFIFCNPKVFPSEHLKLMEAIIEQGMAEFQGANRNEKYERYMKLAGPHWLSVAAQDDESAILEPMHYKSYWKVPQTDESDEFDIFNFGEDAPEVFVPQPHQSHPRLLEMIAQNSPELSQVDVTQLPDVTILKDFEMFLKALKSGLPLTAKNKTIKSKALQEINERLTCPEPIYSPRAQQSSYTMINGMVMLLGASGMAKVYQVRSEYFLALNPERFEQWLELSENDQFFSLMRYWLYPENEAYIGVYNKHDGGRLFQIYRLAERYAIHAERNPGEPAPIYNEYRTESCHFSLAQAFGVAHFFRFREKNSHNTMIQDVHFTEFGALLISSFTRSLEHLILYHPSDCLSAVWINYLKDFIPKWKHTF